MGRTVDTWGEVPIPPRVCERVLEKVVMGPNGCHVSTYSVTSRGYAQIGWNDEAGRHGTVAHRAAWTGVHGPIPLGMTLDHRPICVRRCVNVTHLRELPNLENARRTNGRDWELGTCANGHDHDEHWHQPAGGGKGYCRKCRNAIAVAWRAANPEKARAQWARSDAKRRGRKRVRAPVVA